jgi:F-type H+-transporting ATPase subunit gamma
MALRASSALRPAVSSTPLAPRGVRHATLKAIEMRIKATGNIAKITKAMKMVAAAKLRQVQEKNELARPFTEGAKSFLEPYQEVIAGLPEDRVLKHLVIPLTGDRGLCGSINTNIGKYVKAMLATDANDEVTVIAIGQKSQDAMNKIVPGKTTTSFRDVGKVPMNFAQACVCAEDIVNAEFDKATIVFTTFKNALTQAPTSFTIPSKSLIEEFPQALEDYEFDTDNEAMLSMEDLVEFQLASLLNGFLLDTATSTEAARMSAMDSSTSNANELIDNLTINYNKARQAKITGELIEIISGAEAV